MSEKFFLAAFASFSFFAALLIGDEHGGVISGVTEFLPFCTWLMTTHRWSSACEVPRTSQHRSPKSCLGSGVEVTIYGTLY